MHIAMMLALTHRASVAEKAREGPSLVGAKNDTEKFGPLKTVLEEVLAQYANREVCLQPIYSNSPLTNTFQESVAVGNRVANLLRRIVALEELFDLPPPLGDVAEQRRRRELIS